MQILMVTPWFGGVMGVGTAVKGLTEALTTQGHTVDVLHIAPGKTSAVTLVDHAGQHRRPRPLDAVLEWQREYDIVHFHDDASSDGRDGGFSQVRRRHPVPVVLTLHSLAHQHQLAVGASPWRTCAQEAIQADLIEQASAVLVLTEHSRSEMIARFTDREQIFHVTGNGVAPPGPLPDGWGWFRRELGWGSDLKIVLFLGRLSREKGVEALAKAFAGLHQIRPAARLVVAGPPVGDVARRAEAVLEGAGLRHGIEYFFVGPVGPEMRDGLLNDAQVVVLPSTAEQFPMVALESMSRGRACVVSALSSLRETFRLDDPRERLALPISLPPTPDSIRRALLEALSSPEIPAMVERAQRATHERFSWQQAAAKTLQVYEALRCSADDHRNIARTTGQRVSHQLESALQPGSGASDQDIMDLGSVALNLARVAFREEGSPEKQESLRQAGYRVWNLTRRNPAHEAAVSVVIPVHLPAEGGRGLEYLHEAIASVLSQDLGLRVAILVVDDGSGTDVRADLEAAYPGWAEGANLAAGRSAGASMALHFLQLPGHTGHPGIVRLEGYRWAIRTRTPFVAHLDSDDRMLPHRLRVTLRHLQAHPMVDLVHAAHCSMDANGLPLEDSNDVDRWFAGWRRHGFILDPAREDMRGQYHRHDANELGALAAGANFVHNATVLIRTSALLRLGSEHLVPRAPPGREDHELWIKLGRGGSIDYLNEVVGCYRQHAGSLSARGRRTMVGPAV
jgi:starch synthase